MTLSTYTSLYLTEVNVFGVNTELRINRKHICIRFEIGRLLFVNSVSAQNVSALYVHLSKSLTKSIRAFHSSLQKFSEEFGTSAQHHK